MKSSILTRLAVVLALFNSSAYGQVYDQAEIREYIQHSTLTCSSSVRFQNLGNNYYLYSSEVGYGQGSGQQIVSCHQAGDEVGTLWSVKESEYSEEQTAEENELCQTGQPITCG